MADYEDQQKKATIVTTGDEVTEVERTDVVEAQPVYAGNVGPSSDPNAPYVDPDRPDVEFVHDTSQSVPASSAPSFNEQADEWLASKQADVEFQRNTGDWVEDYPDWTIWQTDDRRGVWHAAHKNSVDYFQVSNEDDLKGILSDYGKDKD